jgi:hypothetical protein
MGTGPTQTSSVSPGAAPARPTAIASRPCRGQDPDDAGDLAGSAVLHLSPPGPEPGRRQPPYLRRPDLPHRSPDRLDLERVLPGPSHDLDPTTARGAADPDSKPGIVLGGPLGGRVRPPVGDLLIGEDSLAQAGRAAAWPPLLSSGSPHRRARRAGSDPGRPDRRLGLGPPRPGAARTRPGARHHRPPAVRSPFRRPGPPRAASRRPVDVQAGASRASGSGGSTRTRLRECRAWLHPFTRG